MRYDLEIAKPLHLRGGEVKRDGEKMIPRGDSFRGRWAGEKKLSEKVSEQKGGERRDAVRSEPRRRREDSRVEGRGES